MPYVLVDSEFRDKQEHSNSADFTVALSGHNERRQVMCTVTLVHLWGDLGHIDVPYVLLQFGNAHTRYPAGVFSNNPNADRVQFFAVLKHAGCVHRSGSDMTQRLRISLGEYLRFRLLGPDGRPLQLGDTRIVAMFNIVPVVECVEETDPEKIVAQNMY